MQFDRNLALLDEMCLKYSQLATMIQEFEVRLTWIFMCTNAWLCHGDYSRIYFFLELHQCSHIGWNERIVFFHSPGAKTEVRSSLLRAVFVSVSVAHTLPCVHTEFVLVNLQIREYILLKPIGVVSQSLINLPSSLRMS